MAIASRVPADARRSVAIRSAIGVAIVAGQSTESTGSGLPRHKYRDQQLRFGVNARASAGAIRPPTGPRARLATGGRLDARRVGRRASGGAAETDRNVDPHGRRRPTAVVAETAQVHRLLTHFGDVRFRAQRAPHLGQQARRDFRRVRASSARCRAPAVGRPCGAGLARGWARAIRTGQAPRQETGPRDIETGRRTRPLARDHYDGAQRWAVYLGYAYSRL